MPDLKLTLIDPDPDQPRQYLDPVALAELADSMRANGQAVAILVRPVGDRFMIIHGERRVRAAQTLGWDAIRADVRATDPDGARWLALVENVQRADLSPMEEARAYQRRLDQGMTQDQIAQRIGKTRTYIAQKVRLLTLPEPLTLFLDRGALSEGHLRQLLRLKALFGPDLEHDFGHTITANFHETLPEDGAWLVMGPILLDTLKPYAVPPFRFQWLTADLADVGPIYVRRPDDFKRCLETAAAVLPVACRALYGYLYAGEGKRPQWEMTACWWAALATVFGLSVAELHEWIDAFEHYVNSALAVFPLYFPSGDTGFRRVCEWFFRGEDSGVMDSYLSDIAACQIMPLALDTARTAHALQAIGGPEGKVSWPSRRMFGPVSRDTGKEASA
jgi:ParB/RepB/Spo0J family partition protein